MLNSIAQKRSDLFIMGKKHWKILSNKPENLEMLGEKDLPIYPDVANIFSFT